MSRNDMLGSLVRVLTTVPEKGLGLLTDLARKMSGNDRAQWLEETAKLLSKKPTWEKDATTEVVSCASTAKRVLTPWRRIKGGGTTLDSLLTTLGSMTSDWAKGMMGRPAFIISERPYEADLVILTPRDLGFTSSPRTDEFMTKEFCAEWSAKHLDGQVIELCEPEDGPQLRLQYDDQPSGETVWMAMERITVSVGYPSVFRVERYDDGDRWLYGDCALADDGWNLDNQVVFRLRKVQPSGTGN